jgi:hypothetical protein
MGESLAPPRRYNACHCRPCPEAQDHVVLPALILVFTFIISRWREMLLIGALTTPICRKIESKHINLRTRIKRLVRRTICFSKTERMHDLVIGLFINRYEFGRAL